MTDDDTSPVMRGFVALFLGALALTGCLPGPDSGSSSGATDGGSDSAAANPATTREGRACLDMAQAYAYVGERCGDTFEGAGTKFVNTIAGGDCNKVSIRNEAELRNQCIPSFASLSCSDFVNNRFAPSCAGQIIQ